MPSPAVYDSSNKSCCICFDDFNNGDHIVVLCDNNHVICGDCCLNWEYTHPLLCDCDEPTDNDYKVTTLEFDNVVHKFVKRDLSESQPCPVCREPVNGCSLYMAQVYYPGSGTETSPININ